MNYRRADEEGGYRFADVQKPQNCCQIREGDSSLGGVRYMRDQGLRIMRSCCGQTIGRRKVGYGLSDGDESGEESERSS